MMQQVPSRDSAASYPYVMIAGSYKDSTETDSLCKALGIRLSELNIGVVSGGCLPGINVCFSFFGEVSEKIDYDPARITTYYRQKEGQSKRLVDSFASVVFFGNTPTDIRKYMISKVKAVIVIGGNSGTTEEVHLATINNIPVIPVACSGGFAAVVHNMYKTNFYGQFIDTAKYDDTGFEALKSNDLDTALNAVITCLKSSIKVDS